MLTHILSYCRIPIRGHPCTYDVRKINGFVDPLSPCLHLGLIHSTKSMQHVILLPNFGYRFVGGDPKSQILRTSHVNGPPITLNQLQDLSMSGDSANNPGYLVLMKCSASTVNGSADDACIGWTGDTIYVKPTAETTISLSEIEVRPC